ncbi:MAG: hypothetical protein V1895_04165 [Parcubacteria group bacterium]
MKFLVSIIIVLMFVITGINPAYADQKIEIKGRPVFVQKLVDSLTSDVLTRPLGWGELYLTVTDQVSEPVYWVAWYESDGIPKMKLSTSFTPDQIGKLPERWNVNSNRQENITRIQLAADLREVCKDPCSQRQLKPFLDGWILLFFNDGLGIVPTSDSVKLVEMFDTY